MVPDNSLHKVEQLLFLLILFFEGYVNKSEKKFTRSARLCIQNHWKRPF